MGKTNNAKFVEPNTHTSIVTDLPTPLEIAANTIPAFPSPSASSPAQSGDNSNSQSLSDTASAADATDSPLTTPPSPELPHLPSNSQTQIPTNTQSSLSPLRVYQRRNTIPPTPMASQPACPILELELTPSPPQCPSPPTRAVT
ncbi:hypothetical protein KY284_001681 [Solanum tuberosum]|nr:hypothetical protein KY284_001681 [Solanum tuberosum]